jgi:hypothetical protein
MLPALPMLRILATLYRLRMLPVLPMLRMLAKLYRLKILRKLPRLLMLRVSSVALPICCYSLGVRAGDSRRNVPEIRPLS